MDLRHLLTLFIWELLVSFLLKNISTSDDISSQWFMYGLSTFLPVTGWPLIWKKLYNLTVHMACTVKNQNFHWLNIHLHVHAANKRGELELCRPFEKLNCTVFFYQVSGHPFILFVVLVSLYSDMQKSY